MLLDHEGGEALLFLVVMRFLWYTLLGWISWVITYLSFELRVDIES